MDPGDYRDAAVPLALGLVAGVPVAVWLTRLGDRAAEGRERAEARDRRRLVLVVIRSELVGDLAAPDLLERIASERGGDRRPEEEDQARPDEVHRVPSESAGYGFTRVQAAAVRFTEREAGGSPPRP